MEPFKNQFNPQVIDQAAGHLAGVWSGFDRAGFVAACIEGLDAMELKARSNHIAAQLAVHLPADWDHAVDVMTGALGDPSDPDASASNPSSPRGIAGFMIMPLCEVVVLRGLDHHGPSMRAFHALTQRFSAEFAIRPFLAERYEPTMRTLDEWVSDPSPHVRRLVSEGTRPRLPWGMRLGRFVDDPTPTLALLERLKDDPSEYVRRSVANHLGDIAKDHPDRAVVVARGWYGSSPARQKLVRHGLRWLVKQGHPGALAVLGYGEVVVEASLELSANQATVGESLGLRAVITSGSERAQSLLIDYAVHHVKADGSLSPKVFKWTARELAPGGRLSIQKKHSLKPVTTRRYYPGRHRIDLQVNGKPVASAEFELSVES